MGQHTLSPKETEKDLENNEPHTISPGKSAIVQDPKLTKEIHEENINKLNQMSVDDIMTEREKLLSSLGEWNKKKRGEFKEISCKFNLQILRLLNY